MRSKFLSICFSYLLIGCFGGTDTKPEPIVEPEPIVKPEPIEETDEVQEQAEALKFPSNISNHYISMALETGDINLLRNIMPDIEGNFRFRTLYSGAARNSLHFYLQHDKYLGWQYEGEYSIQNPEDGVLEIEAHLTESDVKFDIEMSYLEDNAGQWQMEIQQQVLSGTFEVAPTVPLTEYQLKGSTDTNIQIVSSLLNFTYQYHVYLPEGYQDNIKDYPLVIKTDGNYGFIEFSKQLELNQTKAIFVAIEQGPDGRREIDFREPGVSAYLDFYEHEFLPELQSLYRIDEEQRTLFGHSYGGLLVRSAMIRDKRSVNEQLPRLFRNYIAADGAYWYQEGIYKEQEDEVYGNQISFPGVFVLAGANFQGLAPQVADYKNALLQRNINDLSIFHESYNMNHNQVIHPVFSKGISLIFPRK
ncbi:alpha/beta hydrolase [Agaribacter marinus]|uniref:Esterase n=1 Tax=Agaribacter marinus TaxID=1431249 RepID=A0AA37SXV3_9ALTE|nr:alpha/beta hydrolase-fold protein [Agaribacter marinus]GLR69701.1 hypothetical protein GCM10007852_06090 [Agaribacter marinus]